MPVDASIPLQGKRPDTFGKLSELMSMQRAAIATEAAKTELAGAQQSLRQRQAIANVDWTQYNGQDGTTDLNKFFADRDLQAKAGDSWQKLAEQAVSIKQAQLAAKQTLLGLTNAQLGMFSQVMGGLRSNPEVVNDTPAGRDMVRQGFMQFAQMAGPDADAVLRAYAGPIQNAPPGKLGQVVNNIQVQGMSAAQQVSAQGPQMISTGGELRDINPLSPTRGSAMPMTLAPGQQEQIITGQEGIPVIQTRGPRGSITGTRPVPGLPTYRPGEVPAEASQTESNQRIIQANREAARVAPDQLARIDSAMKLAEQLSTGGGAGFAQKRANFESAIAAFIPGFDTAANDATKLQLLDKYLEGVAANSSAITGATASTDAARESIARQNASAGYTTDAIRNVLSFAKAQTQAVAAKAKAQERWLEDHGTREAHKFETQWRENYEPLIFQLEASSEAKQRELVKGLSKERREELRGKVKNLRELGAIK